MPRDTAGHLVPGRISPHREVPAFIPRPEYVGKAEPDERGVGNLYSPEEVERIRHAARIAAQAVEVAAAAIAPGVTTDRLDAIVHEYLVAHGAYPSTLGYRGFPKSSCTSVNEIICHGIPDDTALLEGDVVKLDVTAYVDGMHGDLCAAYPVGDVSAQAALLIERTREAMMRGIRAAAPGREVNVIGRAIESYAKRFDYGVVRDYTGHGVGRAFHTGLVIPHYDAAPAYDTAIEPGMVFTVEPMLTLDGSSSWDLWPDDWTVATRSRALTAQFEHTILVTETGTEILTLP
ncbi:type I methionyl aminopeptidase [Pseudolysinimonas sp.]|uniref:type I methionyl aminopeptidase n=1 Tax=Pseudolysinimonas sp. TaxID=2680009 RepID=UPI003F7D9D82